MSNGFWMFWRMRQIMRGLARLDDVQKGAVKRLREVVGDIRKICA